MYFIKKKKINKSTNMFQSCLNTAELFLSVKINSLISSTVKRKIIFFLPSTCTWQKNNNFRIQRLEICSQFFQRMENVTKVWSGPLPSDSPYLKPFRLYFIQNGVEKNWDLFRVHDSVSIIIFNKTRNVLVLVKQFRPAVYHGLVTSAGFDINDVDLKQFPPKMGITLELCAGIVDKDKPWVEIAREEVLEECGYNVPVSRIEEVMTYRSGVGSNGSLQKMYYCEVTDDDKVSSGGGIDEELIEVVEYTLEKARSLVVQGAVNDSPPSFLLGILWFLTNKVIKDA